MASIPQKELRNNLDEVLRRAEAGEQLTITVAGRPVAQLGPLRTRQWVPTAQLADLWATPSDPTLEKGLEALSAEMIDPWAD
jgi:prevent-host-death family protein